MYVYIIYLILYLNIFHVINFSLIFDIIAIINKKIEFMFGT
jgi:hypothetical protein